MLIIYNLDDAISSFFAENTTATRQECDNFALFRAGGRVNPVEIQGAFSYTIIAGTDNSKLFQFRTNESELDTSIISLATTAHPQFVTSCKYHGTIGQSRPLHVYEMEKLPGATYVMARNVSIPQPPDAAFRQRNTATDFAKFFAQSWNYGQRLRQDGVSSLLGEFSDKFDLLSRSLPSRFASNLDIVRQGLPLLFSGTLPFVLTHQDLCEMNTLIDPETGRVTGIVDWAEARILPFGFSMWGFENILGYMNSAGWHYYDNRHELEAIFWQTFSTEAKNLSDNDLELIRIARMTGLFRRYGLVMDGKVVKGVVDQSDPSSIAYLDAFCTTDDWMPRVRNSLCRSTCPQCN
ncbi:hypothetical protein F5Y10DRAFT_272320 [Nemania abortiva]|nr:hypothetical protein F5Y10DRAFT_272320 [Nemania abortiva]